MNMNDNSLQLSVTFQNQLNRHGFVHVGDYELDSNHPSINIEPRYDDWAFVIYSFISFANGGKHVRIGKVEQQDLKARLKPYWIHESLRLRTDIDWVRQQMGSWHYTPRDATPEMLAEFGQFAGGTPPWEREMWVNYSAPFGGRGLIVAQPPVPGRSQSLLLSEERALLELYDPPCNRDLFLSSARMRKAEWIRHHGRGAIRIKRRHDHSTHLSGVPSLHGGEHWRSGRGEQA